MKGDSRSYPASWACQPDENDPDQMARASSIQFWNVTPRSVKGAASQLPTGNPKAMKRLFRARLCDWADVSLTGGLIL
jgi:hypothetical protein